MVNRKKLKIVKKEKIVSKLKTTSIPIIRPIQLKSVSKAKKNALLLEQDFKEAKTKDEQRFIKRKVILASNRADKKMRQRNISKKKKHEYGKIAKIYRNSYQQMVLEEIGSKPEAPAIVFEDI